MPGPDPLLPVLLRADWGRLLGYGPAPGVELIPYFLALLAWAGVALAGVLVWPISRLLQRLRKFRDARRVEPQGEPPPAVEK